MTPTLLTGKKRSDVSIACLEKCTLIPHTGTSKIREAAGKYCMPVFLIGGRHCRIIFRSCFREAGLFSRNWVVFYGRGLYQK